MGLLYSILTSLFLSFAPTADIPYADIERAFSNNDHKTLSNLGKDKMVVNVQGTEGVYSQSQAGLILKEFFSRYPCTSFGFTFKGKANSEGAFAIGNYQSKSSKFRVTIHVEQIGSGYRIESLSIEQA